MDNSNTLHCKSVDDRFWEKYRFVNFILALLIITAHIYSSDFVGLSSQNSADAVIARIILAVFKNHLSQLGVPMFFAMSGFMFFRNLTWKDIPRKLKSRLMTIVVPYLLWNTISFLFYFAISNIGVTSRFLSMEPVVLSFKTVFEGVFLHYYSFYMWFLKVLIIFLLLSPLFFLSLKNRIVSTICLIALCFFGIMYPHKDLNTFKYSICFYYIGAYVGTYYRKQIIESNSRKRGWISLGIILFFMIIHIIFESDLPYQSLYVWKILSVCLVWFAFDVVCNFNSKCAVFSLSFFIYCTHELFIRVLDKVVWRFTGYVGITIPLICTAVGSAICSIVLGLFLKKVMPHTYALLTGNR